MTRTAIMGASLVALAAAAALIAWALSFSYSTGEAAASLSPQRPIAGASATGDPSRGQRGGSPSPNASALTAVNENTFDEIVVGGLPTAGWSIHADADGVGVVAFPTAVDRSLRIAGSETSDAMACSETPPRGIASVDMNLLLESTAGGQVIVELLRGNERLLAILLVVDHTDAAADASTILPAAVEADRWYRLTGQFDVGMDDAPIAIADAESGTRIARLSAVAEAGSADRICFTTRGTPTPVRLYLDSVRITSQ